MVGTERDVGVETDDCLSLQFNDLKERGFNN
jgi:hypothetical protein